jgi:hypothetical protein
MTDPETTKGETWFSDPTTFTVLKGASIKAEAGARIELVEGSTIHLLPGSTLHLDNKATLRIEAGSQVIVHPTATLQGKACRLRKLRKKGLVVEPAP